MWRLSWIAVLLASGAQQVAAQTAGEPAKPPPRAGSVAALRSPIGMSGVGAGFHKGTEETGFAQMLSAGLTRFSGT